MPSIMQTVELRLMSNTQCAKERKEKISNGKACAKKPPGVSYADACRVCMKMFQKRTDLIS